MDKGEFDLIKSYFAPLTGGYDQAYDLKNDAALISEKPENSSVVTMDTLIEGVHFFMSDPADDIARKCLRVNLSDLAAMGATALGYTLSMAYSDRVDSQWVNTFTSGLASDQAKYDCHLLGGDTVSTPGPLTITVTCFGSVPRNKCLRRDTARVGEDIWVSGTLGDAAAGLRVLKKELFSDDPNVNRYLIGRYRIPEPRMTLGSKLLKQSLCKTAMDVSDGLLADISHIAKNSSVKVQLYAAQIPLSKPYQSIMSDQKSLRTELAVSGGDDYELLFTSHPDNRKNIEQLSQKLPIQLTRIGIVSKGEGVSLLDEEGGAYPIDYKGWRHF